LSFFALDVAIFGTFFLNKFFQTKYSKKALNEPYLSAKNIFLTIS